MGRIVGIFSPVVLVAYLMVVSAPAWCIEEILFFSSEARVEEKSGAIVFTDSIRFRAEGDKIRFGLVRSLPKKIMNGNSPQALSYELLHSFWQPIGATGPSAQETVPVAVKETDGQVQYYIGTEGKPLAHGVHEFSLQYRVRGAITNVERQDGFLWFITGTWPFPIHQVQARFFPPARVTSSNIQARAWTSKTTSGWFGRAHLEQEPIPTQVSHDTAEKNDLGEPKPLVVANIEGQQEPNTSVLLQVSWPQGFLGAAEGINTSR